MGEKPLDRDENAPLVRDEHADAERLTAALEEADPGRAHLDSDPELEAMLTAYQAFLATGVPPGADVGAAERRLAGALDVEIFGDAERAASPAGTGGGLPQRVLARLFAPPLRGALALGALALVAGALYVGTRGERGDLIGSFEIVAEVPTSLRGTAHTERRLRAIAEAGAVTLEWPARGPGEYVVVLTTPAHEEIARLGPFNEPTTRIRIDALPPAAHEHPALFWRVIDGGSAQPREETGSFLLR